MDGFEKHTIQTSRGLTYTYYVSRSKDEDKSLPALLFHHGWPDHAAMWSPISTHLRKLGVRNTIIAPDMLGYEGTSKPTDPGAYTFDQQTRDITEILDAQNIPLVITIGHDWGSRAAARLYNFHPDRVSGMILFNVPYQPPTREPFSLEATNAAVAKIFGYPLFEYWHLFTSPDGPDVLRSNVSRLFSALHAAPKNSMRDFFCVPDALRNYLLADPATTPEPAVRPYAQAPEMRRDFVERMTRDGFEGPQCWYRAIRDGHHYTVEHTLPADRDAVVVPLLYVGATEDAVCRPEGAKPVKDKGLLPDLEEHMVEAAHWSPYEKPDELAGFIAAWLDRKFGSAKGE